MIYDGNGNIISINTGIFEKNKVYNLLDIPPTRNDGYINSTGGVNKHSSYKYTDFIDVGNNAAVYRVTNLSSISSSSGTACYDSNKNLLGVATASEQKTIYNINNDKYYHCKLTLLENTRYIKTSIAIDITDMYISTNDIGDKFDISSTLITTNENKEQIRNAIDIPDISVLNRFKGKTLLVAGDSITEKNSTASKVWSEHLGEWLGLNVYNDAKGGTGFARNYMGRGSTITRIETMWDNLYPAEPDIILVMGNMNDGTNGGAADTYPSAAGKMHAPVGTESDTADVFSEYGIMRRLLSDLTTKYPRAKIGMISSTPRHATIDHWVKEGVNGACDGHGWYEGYLNAQKYVCAEFGVPFLDLYSQNPVLRPYSAENAAEFYADGTVETGEPNGVVHPNSKGHLEGIAIPIYSWMIQWC